MFGWTPAQVGQLSLTDFWYFTDGFDQMAREAARERQV